MGWECASDAEALAASEGVMGARAQGRNNSSCPGGEGRGGGRAACSAAKNIKRFVGSLSFCIEGVSHKRWLQSFTQWMAQHPLDAYAGLDEDARSRGDVWLRRVGGYEAMQTPVPTRVRREHIRLVPA